MKNGDIIEYHYEKSIFYRTYLYTLILVNNDSFQLIHYFSNDLPFKSSKFFSLLLLPEVYKIYTSSLCEHLPTDLENS